MEDQNTIQLDEIKQFSDRIFDVLRRAGVSQIAMPDTPYWRIDDQDIYSGPEAPKPVSGDVASDLSDLRWNLENIDEQFDIRGSAQRLAVMMTLIALADDHGIFSRRQRSGGRR